MCSAVQLYKRVVCTGRHATDQDYSVVGSRPTKAFNALGSLGTMAFAYNTVILPEIQVIVQCAGTDR